MSLLSYQLCFFFLTSSSSSFIYLAKLWKAFSAIALKTHFQKKGEWLFDAAGLPSSLEFICISLPAYLFTEWKFHAQISFDTCSSKVKYWYCVHFAILYLPLSVLYPCLRLLSPHPCHIHQAAKKKEGGRITISQLSQQGLTASGRPCGLSSPRKVSQFQDFPVVPVSGNWQALCRDGGRGTWRARHQQLSCLQAVDWATVSRSVCQYRRRSLEKHRDPLWCCIYPRSMHTLSRSHYSCLILARQSHHTYKTLMSIIPMGEVVGGYKVNAQYVLPDKRTV